MGCENIHVNTKALSMSCVPCSTPCTASLDPTRIIINIRSRGVAARARGELYVYLSTKAD